MSTGWKCPGCGACYAPWVAVCGNCKAITTPIPQPPTIPDPGIFPKPNITCGGPER